MIFQEFNKKTTKKSILIAPLDWGLGHATRCIPIIKELTTLHFNIIIAATGKLKTILQQEFPTFHFIDCPLYNIRYSNNKYWLPVKLLFQAPKIVLTIIEERIWIKKVVKKYNIHAIVSDNRFGLYHSGIPSVYITHQLHIKTGNSISEAIAQKIHYWFIKQYRHCWVPDVEGVMNLAGELSHPAQKPSNTQYIGCLSRFDCTEPQEKKTDLLVVLSGPEPQRSIFEKLILRQVKEFSGNVILVRGLPGGTANKDANALKNEAIKRNIEIKDHLPAEELCNAILQAKMVVCRSGYTSVMDLTKLQQKAILVPTPGQTEQEYLAAHLMQQGIFFSTAQENFHLLSAIRQAENFPFSIPALDMDSYKKKVQEFAQSI